MNRKLTVFTVALAVGISASAQERPKDAGIHDLITVDHHKVCVDITDFQGGTISGHADLMVRSKAAKTRSISLNLLSMEVDEVSCRGKVLPEGSFSYDGSVLSIDLPRPLKTRKATPVGVSYHGTPQGRSFGGFTQEDLVAYQREVDFLATYIKKGDRRYHPIADTPETDTYGNIVYKKGAWVTRKLRQLLGDEAFFGALRNYVTEFAFDNATTEEFKASMERSTGTDLSDFFNEYIYN